MQKLVMIGIRKMHPHPQASFFSFITIIYRSQCCNNFLKSTHTQYVCGRWLLCICNIAFFSNKPINQFSHFCSIFCVILAILYELQVWAICSAPVHVWYKGEQFDSLHRDMNLKEIDCNHSDGLIYKTLTTAKVFTKVQQSMYVIRSISIMFFGIFTSTLKFGGVFLILKRILVDQRGGTLIYRADSGLANKKYRGSLTRVVTWLSSSFRWLHEMCCNNKLKRDQRINWHLWRPFFAAAPFQWCTILLVQ